MKSRFVAAAVFILLTASWVYLQTQNSRIINLPLAVTQSGTWNIGSVTTLPAISLSQTGTNNDIDANITNSSLAVTGTFWQATQPVSLASLPTLAAGTNNIGDVDIITQPVITDKASANNAIIGNISLGNSLGKTNVLRTAILVTTATTVDQVILTYTVTSGKTLYVMAYDFSMSITTPGTGAVSGNMSVESPAGTKIDTNRMASVGMSPIYAQQFSEPIPIPAGTVIRIVVTPANNTSTTWSASFTGYEK